MKKKRHHLPFVLKWVKKPVFVLQVAGIMCLLSTVQSFAAAQQNINLNLKNVTVEYALKRVTQETGLDFFYNNTDIDASKRVSVEITDATLTNALNIILGGTVNYYIRDNVVAITSVQQPPANSDQRKTLSGMVRDVSGQPVSGVTVLVKGTTYGGYTNAKGEFSFQAVVLPSSVLSITCIGMAPQQIAIGKQEKFTITVREDISALEDVVITGFQKINKTNFTGASSKLAADDLKVKGTTDISRMLEGQVAGVSIQNVSSTFGSAPKIRVRGATTINGENKPLWVIDGIVHEDLISITNDELTSGDPTTLLGSAVAGINSNDIESINFLKDASATALYGARAMNGVIVVTTKKGKTGEPTVVYTSNYTVNMRPSYSNYDIMNSADQMSVYAELERDGFLNSDIVNWRNSGIYGKMYGLINTYDPAKGAYLLENTPEAKRNFLMRYANANTDWFKVLFRNSLQQEHSVSVSSGTEKSKTYASASLLHDNGWTIADKVSRFTANIRNDYQFNDKLSVAFLINGSVRRQEAPGTMSRTTNVVEGKYDRSFDINPFSYALNTSRAMTAYDENGELEYFTRNYAPFNIINEIQNNRIKLDVRDIRANIETSYTIMPGLKWDVLASARFAQTNKEHEITEFSNFAQAHRAAFNSTVRAANRYLFNDPDDPNGQRVIVLPAGGFYNTDETMMETYYVRNNLYFDKTFADKHIVSVLVGQEVKATDRKEKGNIGPGYQYAKGGEVFIDYMYYKMMNYNNLPSFYMSKKSDRFAAFYGNANYTYDGRYVVQATFRYDGSNALGKKASARWLPTWTVSGKWNAHNENFLKDKVSWINELGIRLSYGLVATMPPSSNAQAIFRNAVSRRQYVYDRESYINLEYLENSDLSWEKGYVFDSGIDLVLLNNRLRFSFDFYNKNSFDNMDWIKTSGIGGQMSKFVNYADMTSSGFDIMLGGTPIRIKDFSWNSNLTFGYNHSEIKKAKWMPRIFDLVRPDGGNLVGYPVNSLFSIRFEKLRDDGMPVFINEYGEPSLAVYMQSTFTEYLKYEGSIDPKYTGGFSNTFTWKGLSLNVFMTFQAGNKIRLSPAYSTTYDDSSALPRSFNDRFVSIGDGYITYIPAIANLATSKFPSGTYPYSNFNYSDKMVAKGDFIRMKTISLSYRVPDQWVRKTKVFKTANITVAGSNLFMIYADKKLNGMDPEFFDTGGVAQPIQKAFTFSLTIGL